MGPLVFFADDVAQIERGRGQRVGTQGPVQHAGDFARVIAAQLGAVTGATMREPVGAGDDGRPGHRSKSPRTSVNTSIAMPGPRSTVFRMAATNFCWINTSSISERGPETRNTVSPR